MLPFFSKKSFAQVFHFLLKLQRGMLGKPIQTFFCAGAIAIYVTRRLAKYFFVGSAPTQKTK